MKTLRPIVIGAVLVCAFTSGLVHADTARSVLIHGDAVTGTNRLKGQPVRDFGFPLGTAGFFNVSAHNPTGEDPLPITPDTPESAILATGVDPEFLSLLGLTLEDVDPALLNVPLREVPVNVDPAGVVRSSLPSVLDVDPLTPSQAYPADPITLADWLDAKGFASVRCVNNTATVRLSVAGLVPNRLYTVWAIFGGDALIPRPLGGVPNVLTTDEHGSGRFERTLVSCPLEPAAGEARMLLIDIVLHSDQQVYGDVPDLPFAGLITGIITHTQLEFALFGDPVE